MRPYCVACLPQMMPGRTWETLDAFSLDEVPLFSRTVLTSSPVLVLPNREGAQLDHSSSFRGSFMSHTNAAPPVTLVRQPSSDGVSGQTDLPAVLQSFVRLHKRAVFSLFKKWDGEGRAAVALDTFAEGVRAISGEKLTDDDLLTVLHCIDPVRGDEVLEGEHWRSRTLDTKRLWRKLQSAAARQASQYIQETSKAGGSPPQAAAQVTWSPVRPISSRRGSASWNAMLQQRGSQLSRETGLEWRGSMASMFEGEALGGAE